jgi:shikimate kinase
MKVIILNGPMGVGKTAVGKYIAKNRFSKIS